MFELYVTSLRYWSQHSRNGVKGSGLVVSAAKQDTKTCSQMTQRSSYRQLCKTSEPGGFQVSSSCMYQVPSDFVAFTSCENCACLL